VESRWSAQTWKSKRSIKGFARGQKDVSLAPWLQPGEKGCHRRSNRFNVLDGGADSPSNGSGRSPAQEAEALISGVLNVLAQPMDDRLLAAKRKIQITC
jgi:hypothetical protein